MAQTEAKTRPRKQRPHTVRRAVKASDEHPADAIGRLLVERCTLERLIRLGKGRRTRFLRVAEMPEHTATGDGGQIHLGGKTAEA